MCEVPFLNIQVLIMFLVRVCCSQGLGRHTVVCPRGLLVFSASISSPQAKTGWHMHAALVRGPGCAHGKSNSQSEPSCHFEYQAPWLHSPMETQTGRRERLRRYGPIADSCCQASDKRFMKQVDQPKGLDHGARITAVPRAPLGVRQWRVAAPGTHVFTGAALRWFGFGLQ